MILAFNPMFEKPINDGSKIHTIREDKHNLWKAGRKIHMASGVRTKNYRCFNDKEKCTGTQRIVITWYFGMRATVAIEGKLLHQEQLKLLAKNDGFPSLKEFFEWFNEDLDRKIIHWTDFRY